MAIEEEVATRVRVVRVVMTGGAVTLLLAVEEMLMTEVMVTEGQDLQRSKLRG